MTISGLGINSYDWGYTHKSGLNTNDGVIKALPNEQEQNLPVVQKEESSKVKAPKILAEGQLEDFAFDFKKNKEFSMTGEDSDITGLDVEKNIAATKKDELLDQYRYFVGEPKQPVQYASADGLVTRVIR